jgi:molecular chaperone GrpE
MEENPNNNPGDNTLNDQNSETPEQNSSALEHELAKVKKDYLYLRADFDNYKKGVLKERSDLLKYGSERIVTELLNVIDVFETALDMEVTAESLDKFKEGLVLTSNEFKNVLERFGVKSVDSLGKPFDPSIHEALSSDPTDDIPAGHVSRVFKKAYKLHDRLIRPAQVVVAIEPKKDST